MEPELRRFFALLLHSISLVLLWLLVNIMAGLQFEVIFVEHSFTLWHAVFYVWVAVTGFFLVRYLRKKWRAAPAIHPESD